MKTFVLATALLASSILSACSPLPGGGVAAPTGEAAWSSRAPWIARYETGPSIDRHGADDRAASDHAASARAAGSPGPANRREGLRRR